MNKYNTPEIRAAREKAWAEARAKAKELVKDMTLYEKISQLTQYTPYTYSEEDYNPPVDDSGAGELTYPRVGSFINAQGVEETNRIQKKVVRDNHQHIPALFANDIIHGYKTTMPTPIAQSATWDPELAKKCCEVAAREAYSAGTRWTFAPMVDIARDPRWGRIVEGFGEDPFLGSDFSAASVVGYQGEQIGEKGHILACLKHFAAYGGGTGGRDYNDVDISLQTLHDVYLAPFKAGVDAGAATLMSAFNSINGVPASGNRYLLWEVLREQWGFEGFIISDWDSVMELKQHGYAEDDKDAVCKGFGAGVDVIMVGNGYNNNLPQLVAEGKISEEMITRSAEVIISFKYLIGLMDEPFNAPEEEGLTFFSDEHLAVSRETGAHAIVLLENDGILPLIPEKQKGKKIAVIGPAADDQRGPLGAWQGPADTDRTVTLLQGIREVYGEYAEIEYIKGAEYGGVDDTPDDGSGIAKAAELAKSADLIIACIGEFANDCGEAASKSMIVLPGRQKELFDAIKESGKPIITLLSTGRPLAVPYLAEDSNALLEIWQCGTEAGHAVADVLTGAHNPSGKLTTTFPRTPGQVPIFYNHLSTGRPALNEKEYGCSRYNDVTIAPLYCFGYGLSYTEFEYSDLRLSADTMAQDGKITVTVKVTNKGEYDGHDVVQLYIRDLIASRCRPVKELKGYNKVFLKAGESRDVTIDLYAEDLAFSDDKLQKIVEPGKFKLWIAHNCLDEAMETEFFVK